MRNLSLKKQIHYLAYFLFIFSYLSLSFETALKAGSASSFRDLFLPITDSFYWPRFIVLLIPSLVLIALSSIQKIQYEYVLKGLFILSAPIIFSRNIDIFSAHVIITPLNQPEHFMQLYYVTSCCNALIWLGIIILGLFWSFQKRGNDLLLKGENDVRNN